MRIFIYIFFLAAFSFFIIQTVSIAGEWSKEELQRMEDERRAYEKSYKAFCEKGVPYQIWLKISKSKFGCAGYNYFPQSGIRGFYCHMKTYIDMETLERISGEKIFLSGPHDNLKPNLSSKSDFGHYNPTFLVWAKDTLIPAKDNQVFLKFSQNIYNHTFSYPIRSYYVVGKILQNNVGLRLSLTKKYIDTMNSGKHYNFYKEAFYLIEKELPPEFKFLEGQQFMYPQHKQYYFKGNIVKSGVYFWLRRDIDGTFSHFLEIGEDILSLYDKIFVNEFIHISDSNVYDKLALSLDREFQLADLNRLSRFQLKLLRNGIFATYGYTFKNERLKAYFKENSMKFCRSQKCGIVKDRFNDAALSEIDKYNIKIIMEVERKLSK